MTALRRLDAGFVAAVLVGAAALGVVISGGLPLPPPFDAPMDFVASVPVAALAALALLAAAAPVLLQRWQVATGGFFAWLVVEDLVRKLAGNDIRVYFVKDLLFAVVVAALLVEPRTRGAWRAAAGQVRFPLYALLAWAVALAIPAALSDWRVPLLGLRMNFLYLPLVVAGFCAARERRSLHRWLAALAALGAAACLVGIAQAVVGPGFLAPPGEAPGLILLETVRGTAASGPVYRPSGTFVSSGRFASAALVTVAVALSAVLLQRRRRWLPVGAVLAGAAAVWVSGGRTALLVAAGLVVCAAAAASRGAHRPAVGRSLEVVAVASAAVALVAVLAPSLFASRAIWYAQTLDPSSPDNEWAFRWQAYGRDTIRGVALGGLVGQGTGTESLGKQYLFGGQDYSPQGLYRVEGGYASVAVEWGVVGLGLWVVGTVAWTRRQWRCVRAARASPEAAAGLVLLAWMLHFLFLGFFGGLQGFQNYLPNAYFWFLSGVIFGLPHAAGQAEQQPQPGGEEPARVG